MKQISQAVVITIITLTLLFSSYSIVAARLLPLPKGEDLVKASESTQAGLTIQIQEEDPFNLMGLEEMQCDEKDEDCMKRRMMAEAHLDYIYTQHRKPKELSP